MLKFLLRLAFALAGSALVWLGIGQTLYVSMAGLMAVCVAGMLVRRGNDEHAWPIYIWLGYVTMTAVLIGAFWPVLPIALSWSQSNAARAVRGEHHAAPLDPSVSRPESEAK